MPNIKENNRSITIRKVDYIWNTERHQADLEAFANDQELIESLALEPSRIIYSSYQPRYGHGVLEAGNQMNYKRWMKSSYLISYVPKEVSTDLEPNQYLCGAKGRFDSSFAIEKHSVNNAPWWTWPKRTQPYETIADAGQVMMSADAAKYLYEQINQIRVEHDMPELVDNPFTINPSIYVDTKIIASKAEGYSSQRMQDNTPGKQPLLQRPYPLPTT